MDVIGLSFRLFLAIGSLWPNFLGVAVRTPGPVVLNPVYIAG